MVFRFKGCFYVACVALVAACVTESGFRAAAQKRIGQDVNQLIREKGPPDASYAMPNGNVMLTWARYGTDVSVAGAVLGGMGSGLSGQPNYGARPYRTSCVVNYEVDGSTQRVVSFRYEGNACKQ